MAGFTCCVPGCCNNSTRHKGLGFHSFPKDRQLREKWIAKASQGSGDESGSMAINSATARTFTCSIVVQHEHSYGLPAEWNKELKKIIFDQRADLLILQKQLEEASETIESLRTKGRELEAQSSKTLDVLRRSNEKLEIQLRFLQRDHAKLKERLRERPQEFQYAALI
ncbi:hypothetical protein HPB47_023152 [Ixodes persulcatus]|uniref:Uncharacterized protein n=1 Tax=Ixodes persulcatus TaxID=34615 RepID=A0AC60QAZ6_IXOPE|nr:hypothetical protein HPB47_023152 [Ixodes persulcatus]